MHRLFPALLLLGACRPTSLLELSLFVSADALGQANRPAAVYVDYGPGQLDRAVSMCDWNDGEFRETTLDPVEYPPCPDTLTIQGVLAPLPEGATCNEGAILLLPPPEDSSTWFASGTVEVFATDDCSIIEEHRLVIEGG